MDDLARLRVSFPCQYEGCPKTAAMVEVSRRGQLFVNDEQDVIYRIFPAAQGTIRVTDFLPYTTFSSRVPDYAATAQAARAIDASALHALDHTWVPFYCPHCERSFCTEHWALTPHFNWGFDHYSGTCPIGHPHTINHC